jgi:tRNA G10  N-methylase Trm11
MRTVITLAKGQLEPLPVDLRGDDVRYPPELVRLFLQEHTRPGDLVFDPFAGFGTTLAVAAEMGRRALGIELDSKRCAFIRSHSSDPGILIEGDARQLDTLGLPSIDFSMTSPPYMSRWNHPQDPLTAYVEPSRGYATYLAEIRDIYRQIGGLMTDRAVAVVEVANLKAPEGVTTLAWDLAAAIGEVLRFEGEVIMAWDPTYGYGYDHSYCLLFRRRDTR